MAGNSSKYFAVQPTQNHHEVTELSNDTFFMNTLNEFLFVNGTVHTNPILSHIYITLLGQKFATQREFAMNDIFLAAVDYR